MNGPPVARRIETARVCLDACLPVRQYELFRLYLSEVYDGYPNSATYCQTIGLKGEYSHIREKVGHAHGKEIASQLDEDAAACA